MSYPLQYGFEPTVRYFQILYRNAEGKTALTASIVMKATRELRPSDCLKYTTEFVRSRLISIWEVAS